MTERSFQEKQERKYRWGFNGKENDEDLDGQDYGFRIYRENLGKFLSVDPLSPKYPMLTPYQFASNTPIMAIDLDGLESVAAIFSVSGSARAGKGGAGVGLKGEVGFAVLAVNTEQGIQFAIYRTISAGVSVGKKGASGSMGVSFAFSPDNQSVSDAMGNGISLNLSSVGIGISAAGNVTFTVSDKENPLTKSTGTDETWSITLTNDEQIGKKVKTQEEAVAALMGLVKDYAKLLEDVNIQCDPKLVGTITQVVNSVVSRVENLVQLSKTGEYEMQWGDHLRLDAIANTLGYSGRYSMFKNNGITQAKLNKVKLLGYDGTKGGGRGDKLKAESWFTRFFRGIFSKKGEEKEAEQWHTDKDSQDTFKYKKEQK